MPATLSIYVEKVYQPVVAEKALLSFGVDAQHISQPLFGSNAVVKVASMHSEYALRLHRASRSPQRIDRELAFVSALRQQNALRVPCPVKTISGDYSCTVFQDGNEFRCSLLTWIKGEPLPGGLVDDILKAIGHERETFEDMRSSPPCRPRTIT